MATASPSTAALLARLRIRHPILQAPMAGVSTPRMAAEVSEAGGLGALGLGAAASVEAAAEPVRATRALTGKPFNVNFFCHAPARPDPAREARWLAHLAPEFRRFGAEPPQALSEIYRTAVGHDAMLRMVLEEKPAVASFHFGLPGPEWIAALRAAGIVTLATATSAEEAAQVEQAGVDAIVAQGWEAGGHRGSFDPARDTALGTFALVGILARRARIPVIAAGGIMDGAGIAAALELGAAAVQLGTAFILCPESSASPAYRAELQSEQAHHTAVTSAISGRPARGLFNRLHALGLGDAPPVPDYPIAYDAGKALHQAAAKQGEHGFAAHWAGQGAPLARGLPARELVATLVREWQEAAA